MPRPKSNFPNFKAYGFSVVIHNVKPQAKKIMEEFCDDTKPLWSVLAQEPDQDRTTNHLHIFIKWSAQHRSVKWFRFHATMKHLLITEKPPGQEGEWGRIQVDTLYGDKDSCVKYLTNPDKDKEVDENVLVKDNARLDLIERWASAAVLLNRKFLFPEYFADETVTCFEYIRRLERLQKPIPEYYQFLMDTYERGIDPREKHRINFC